MRSLRSIHLGIGWVRRAMIVSIVVSISLVMLAMSQPWDFWGLFWWCTFCILGPVTSHILFVAGAYQVTVREHQVLQGYEYPPCRRRIIRSLAVIGLAGAAVMPICEFAQASEPLLAIAFSFKFSVSGMIYLLYQYLRTLARCVPDQALARSTTILMYATPVGLAAIFIFTVAGGITSHPSQTVRVAIFAINNLFNVGGHAPITLLVAGIGVFISAIVSLIAYLWGLRVLAGHRNILERTVKELFEEYSGVDHARCTPGHRPESVSG